MGSRNSVGVSDSSMRKGVEMGRDMRTNEQLYIGSLLGTSPHEH